MESWVWFGNCKSFFMGNGIVKPIFNNNPDFVKVAEAYGIRGIRVDSMEQVHSALAEAIAYPGPVLLDITISPNEDVLPIVPPGKPITEMLGG